MPHSISPRPMRRRLLAAAAFAMLALPAPGHAQADKASDKWPGKPVRLVVPASAGGSLDTLARPLAQMLSQLSGQQFIIDNRGGAGGMIGADFVAKAAPDGTTFLLGATHHMILPSIVAKMPYDTEKDLVPVTLVATTPNVVIVNANSPVHSVRELTERGRKAGAGLNYGTGGVGTLHHLSTETFRRAAHVDMQAVHYKGSAPALADLLSGQIDLMFETMPSALPQLQAKKFRALAVTSATRSPVLPDVPTLAEQGFPGMEFTTWYGLFAPAGTPPEIVARMARLTATALAAPKLVSVWKQNGATPGGNPPEAFQQFVRQELRRWGQTAREVGLRAE